jgi:hypothetical protein
VTRSGYVDPGVNPTHVGPVRSGQGWGSVPTPPSTRTTAG